MKPRNVIVLLVIALLCAGAWFWLEEGGGSGADTTLPAVWPKFEKHDVTAIQLSGQGSTLKLSRHGGPTDRWDVLAETELVRADANAIDDLLAALSGQSVSVKIERAKASDADFAGYGLTDPLVQIELTVPGEPIRLRYGKLTREGGKVYMDTGKDTDVWVVAKDAMELAISAISGGMKDKRLFDSTLFDVAKFEVVKGGVTSVELVRDLTQIWKIQQPWKGYAHPGKFETELNRVVNVEIEKWEEFGAPDLVKYGLDPPAYEVRVTPKGEGRKPETLLVGKDGPTGAYVMEQGTKTVAFVGRRFFEAVSMDPLAYRDRSFTRLGNDGTAIDVRLSGVNYKLEKAGHTWDVAIGTDRRPADGDKVGKLLDRLREWQTVEFLDGQKPEDFDVTEKDFVEIALTAVGRDAPGKLVLLFGREGPPGKAAAGTVYAKRKDDGGLELVESGPYDQLKLGAQQFFRSSVAELPLDAIDEITRETGFGTEGDKVQGVRIQRDVDGSDKTWKWKSGNVGTPDAEAINGMLEVLRSVRAVEWIPYDPAKDAQPMGFRPPLAETMTISVHLRNVAGIEPEPKIYIGKRRPEGGYLCRLVGHDQAGNWVFVLPDVVVDALKKDLEKAPAKEPEKAPPEDEKK
jgi:Domain of unknown function (DUF4340)